MKPRTLLSLPLLGIAISGCQSTSSLNSLPEPEPILPESWSESTGEYNAADWLASFQSPVLSQLVVEARQNNLGLEASLYQFKAAEAASRITKSLRLPSLSANYRGSSSQTLASFAPPVSVDSDTHSLNFAARWEIDLWNRLGQQKNAALEQYRASQYDYDAFSLSLSGQIAKAWFSAIEAQRQYQLAEASAQSFDSNLSTLERRYKRGLAEAFDLRLTRAQASSSRANAAQRRSQMDATIRQLETLLGRYPSAQLEVASMLPEIPDLPAAGIPSDLLDRRPDILAAQSRLAASLSLTKSEMKNWLPSLTLTASDGSLSYEFSDLLDKDFNVWSIAGDVSMALFQSGRLKATRDQQAATYASQVSQYESLVLDAFREVETALRAEADLLHLEEQTQIASDENSQAEAQAWQLYERGLVDIISVLDSQRRAFDASSQLISIRNQRLQNRINLHLALGGDL